MRDRDHTPFPLPPLGDPFQQSPTTIPWDDPLSTLSGFWIETRCGACGKSSAYPPRLMAAGIGWERTLGEIVPRLKCRSCGVPPASAFLVAIPPAIGAGLEQRSASWICSPCEKSRAQSRAGSEAAGEAVDLSAAPVGLPPSEPGVYARQNRRY